MSRTSLTGRRWEILPVPPGITDAPAELHPVAAACLARRVPAGARGAWLHPDAAQLHPPEAMLGLPRAVERIRRAVRDGERIRIVTDYDVDGTTSSLVLQGALRLLGAGDRLSAHIPDRMDEGYGFSARAAEQAIEDGVDLVITADIGVRDHDPVRRCAEAGVDVIVCDHHLPDGASVPEAAHAVLCPPQAGCGYPNKALAACGVSFKLAEALLGGHPRREAILRSMLKVVAIGTVADVVSLATPENHAIVALGLEELRRGRHSPGLAALVAVAGLRGARLDVTDIGFRLAPRINAAGRIESARTVLDLFQARDPRRARALAEQLDRLNSERKNLQARLERRARAALADRRPDFAVVWGPESDGWHRGVVGIVASRLRDALHRPAAVVAVSGDEARGSVRSVPAVHAVRALDAAADLLDRYGGHAAAAGFSLPARRLPALAERLDAFVREHADDEALVPVLPVDAVCEPGELDEELLADLERIGPFGKDHPRPRLGLFGQHPEVRPLGRDGRHLRLALPDGLDAVWWNGAEHAGALEAGPVDLVGHLGTNTWRGRTTLRFTVEDARPAY